MGDSLLVVSKLSEIILKLFILVNNVANQFFIKLNNYFFNYSIFN